MNDRSPRFSGWRACIGVTLALLAVAAAVIFLRRNGAPPQTLSTSQEQAPASTVSVPGTTGSAPASSRVPNISAKPATTPIPAAPVEDAPERARALVAKLTSIDATQLTPATAAS